MDQQQIYIEASSTCPYCHSSNIQFIWGRWICNTCSQTISPHEEDQT